MKNLTDENKTEYKKMSDNEVRLYVKYAHGYAFKQVKPLVWEVDYYRLKSARNHKPPKYTHPNF